jgi:hypothetical protein
VSERGATDDDPDGHDDADDDPPFDVVQAVSDFVETVIEEVDGDPRPDAAEE